MRSRPQISFRMWLSLSDWGLQQQLQHLAPDPLSLPCLLPQRRAIHLTSESSGAVASFSFSPNSRLPQCWCYIYKELLSLSEKHDVPQVLLHTCAVSTSQFPRAQKARLSDVNRVFESHGRASRKCRCLYLYSFNRVRMRVVCVCVCVDVERGDENSVISL